MSISTKLQKDNSELLITTPSKFGFKDYRHFRSSYMENINQVEKYIIDFIHTDDIESCVLGMLLQMHEYIDIKKHSVSLINTNYKLTNVFRICEFDSIFKIKPQT